MTPACGAAVNVTFVPQPEDSIKTVPLARSPSQTTALSGSSRVILISPNACRCRPSESGSLHCAHSSGADLTSVRVALRSLIAPGVRPSAPDSSKLGGAPGAGTTCCGRPKVVDRLYFGRGLYAQCCSALVGVRPPGIREGIDQFLRVDDREPGAGALNRFESATTTSLPPSTSDSPTGGLSRPAGIARRRRASPRTPRRASSGPSEPGAAPAACCRHPGPARGRHPTAAPRARRLEPP